MSGLLGFAGSLTELVIGFLMTTLVFWFVLSNRWDGPRLILASTGLAALAYISGALTAPEARLGSRGLTLLAIILTAAIVGRVWLRREARNHGP